MQDGQRSSITFPVRGRSPRAAGAMLALAALLSGTGCTEMVKEVIRQGAYEVFQASSETFYSELETGVTDWIQQIGPSGAGSSASDASGSSSAGSTDGSSGSAGGDGGG